MTRLSELNRLMRGHVDGSSDLVSRKIERLEFELDEERAKTEDQNSRIVRTVHFLKKAIAALSGEDKE